MNDFSENFHKMLKTLDAVPNINSGGCGISALAIHRWVKNNHVGDFKFNFLTVYKESSLDFYHANKFCIANKDDHWVAATHVFYVLNDKMYDSEGEYKKADALQYYDELLYVNSEENLLSMINGQNWCKSFNREKNVPVIEKHLSISLKDVDLSRKKSKTRKFFETLIADARELFKPIWKLKNFKWKANIRLVRAS